MRQNNKGQSLDEDVYVALTEQLSRRNQQLKLIEDRLSRREVRLSEKKLVLSDYKATFNGLEQS